MFYMEHVLLNIYCSTLIIGLHRRTGVKIIGYLSNLSISVWLTTSVTVIQSGITDHLSLTLHFYTVSHTVWLIQYDSYCMSHTVRVIHTYYYLVKINFVKFSLYDSLHIFGDVDTVAVFGRKFRNLFVELFVISKWWYLILHSLHTYNV